MADARPVFIEVESPAAGNVTVFSASGEKEISSAWPEKKHGLFSYYLMKGLEGKADSNNDKKITNGELLAYMDENVSEKALDLGRQQKPSLTGNPEKVLVNFN